MNKFDRILPVFVTALPLSNLNYPAIAGCGLFHQITLVDGVGQRFFAIDIESLLRGIDKRKGVPMVGSTDDNNINSLLLQQFSEIFETCGFLSLNLFDIGNALVQFRLS